MILDNTMVPVPYDLLLMLQRRGAISFDKGDKTAVYVRQLGKIIRCLPLEPLKIRFFKIQKNYYGTK